MNKADGALSLWKLGRWDVAGSVDGHSGLARSTIYHGLSTSRQCFGSQGEYKGGGRKAKAERPLSWLISRLVEPVTRGDPMQPWSASA